MEGERVPGGRGEGPGGKGGGSRGKGRGVPGKRERVPGEGEEGPGGNRGDGKELGSTGVCLSKYAFIMINGTLTSAPEQRGTKLDFFLKLST